MHVYLNLRITRNIGHNNKQYKNLLNRQAEGHQTQGKPLSLPNLFRSSRQALSINVMPNYNIHVGREPNYNIIPSE